ncbi:MAG: LysR family transcriptional regulator [Treponema sp.]|nr:LysR family transcriptional regulator [Treponema sp.]
MTLQQLKYVIGVSEIGSLNKAAEKLYISQPSLTTAIKDVENEFNIRIFNRSTKGISLTNEGKEFVQHARQIYAQYENLLDNFDSSKKRKKKFAVSCQHYSFCVKSFINLVKKIEADTSNGEYEFAINETRTATVIEDVATMRSEIGILNLSDFNRSYLQKVLKSRELIFTPLVDCKVYVYIWKNHPLAKKKSISFEELQEYPCLIFDQNASSSFYYTEEIFADREYSKIIKTTDRATNLNLMVGLNAFCLCSGIISQELNGDDFIAVPFKDNENADAAMQIGYITKANTVLSNAGVKYLEELKLYLKKETKK